MEKYNLNAEFLTFQVFFFFFFTFLRKLEKHTFWGKAYDMVIQALRAGRRSEQSRDSPSPPPQLLLGPSAKTQAWASPGECQCRTCRCWWSPRGPRLAWCSPKGPAEKGDWASGPLSPLPDLCDASQLLPHPRIQGPPPSPTLTLEGSNRPSGMRSRSAP